MLCWFMGAWVQCSKLAQYFNLIGPQGHVEFQIPSSNYKHNTSISMSLSPSPLSRSPVNPVSHSWHHVSQRLTSCARSSPRRGPWSTSGPSSVSSPGRFPWRPVCERRPSWVSPHSHTQGLRRRIQSIGNSWTTTFTIQYNAVQYKHIASRSTAMNISQSWQHQQHVLRLKSMLYFERLNILT